MCVCVCVKGDDIDFLNNKCNTSDKFNNYMFVDRPSLSLSFLV